MSETNNIAEKLSFLASIDGSDFLGRMRDAGDRCARESLDRLSGLGERAPKCYAQLGRALAVLDSLAGCFFSCRGGDHTIEYLAGRIVATSFAGLSLTQQGFYDESLALSRNAGEIVNLFTLFCVDPDSFDRWRTTPDRPRIFSAVRVRRALEDHHKPVPISKDRYKWLCEGLTHGTPDTKPQSHNILGAPMVGGTFQEAGFLLCLNEAAIVVAFAVPLTAKLVDTPSEARQFAKSEAFKLQSHIGGIQATTIDERWEEARKSIPWAEISESMSESKPL